MNENQYNNRPPVFDEDQMVEVVSFDLKNFRPGWHTLLYNDEVHSMDEVVKALSLCGKDEEEAMEIMMLAHIQGVASAHYEPDTEEGKSACERVEGVLRSFGLQAETYHA